jgi:L-threonylcarbamoyladenylate synthase
MSREAVATARFWSFGEPVEELRALLGRGGVLAIPTESSYGLAADPSNRTGVEAIYRLKGRQGSKALPVVAADLAALTRLGVAAGDPAVRWATPRWPAALTVVAALAAPLAASGGKPELAVRIPGEPRLRALLGELGGALTATSANPAGELPMLDPVAVAAWFDRAGIDGRVIDGGVLPGGPPSTLVAWRDGGPFVLRPGRVRIA